MIGIGLTLLARRRWSPGLRWIRAGLFVALTFSLVMEFSDREFEALFDFAIVGAAIDAEGPW